MFREHPKSPHLIPIASDKLKEKIKDLLSLLRTSLGSSPCSSYFKNETKSGCVWKDAIPGLINCQTLDLQSHLSPLVPFTFSSFLPLTLRELLPLTPDT